MLSIWNLRHSGVCHVHSPSLISPHLVCLQFKQPKKKINLLAQLIVHYYSMSVFVVRVHISRNNSWFYYF